jgi:hypothetical protein
VDCPKKPPKQQYLLEKPGYFAIAFIVYHLPLSSDILRETWIDLSNKENTLSCEIYLGTISLV